MFEYRTNFIPANFVVIGCGGTGGRLVPMLAQFLKTATWLINPKIYLIDHDVVEQKNLVRQNFIKLDLGKPKAVVLAERYSKAFDINIVPVVGKVGDITETNKFFKIDVVERSELSSGVSDLSLSDLSNAIITLCVDSAQARRDILNNLLYLGAIKNKLIIDAGNENDFGQILVYNDVNFVPSGYGWSRAQFSRLGSTGILPGTIPFDIRIPYIPFPMNFYDGLKDAGERSCAELDQTLAINATMATTIMGVIQNFLYNKPIQFHKLNISLTHGITPEYITLKYLEQIVYDKPLSVFSKLRYPRTFEVDKFFNEINLKFKEYEHGKSQDNQAGEKSSQQEKRQEEVRTA